MDKTFEYKDPSQHEEFDGTPYEAAEKTINQSISVLNLFVQSVRDVDTQTRNVYMDRNLREHNDPDAVTYNGTPEYATLLRVAQDVRAIQEKLTDLRKSVTFDQPRAAKKVLPPE